MEQNYTNVLQQNKARLLSLKDLSPQYTKQTDKNGYLQHTQVNPDNGLNINRLEFDAPISKDVFLAFVSDTTRRAEIDPSYKGKVLKQINDSICIFYGYGKPPIFLVDARDFVFIREVTSLEDGTILVHNKSIEYPECPPIKGTERAEMVFQGWFIKETGPNSIHVINVGNMNPKGNIPKSILNSGHKMQLETAQKIVAHLSGKKQ